MRFSAEIRLAITVDCWFLQPRGWPDRQTVSVAVTLGACVNGDVSKLGEKRLAFACSHVR